jgi:1,4-alpha-glucan branching enzyme
MVIKEKESGDVTFICNLVPMARNVYLVGEFNQWNPTTIRMVRCGDGSFQAKLRLPLGEHQYKFVADGVWLNDPDAERQVVNSYSALSSVVTVR